MFEEVRVGRGSCRKTHAVAERLGDLEWAIPLTD